MKSSEKILRKEIKNILLESHDEYKMTLEERVSELEERVRNLVNSVNNLNAQMILKKV